MSEHPKPQRSSSEIITQFTLVKQELELQQAKQQFESLSKELKARRQLLLKRTEAQNKTHSQVEKFKSMEEHRISLPELERKLETNLEQGLTHAEGQRRLQSVGPNELHERAKVPWFVKLFHELTSVFSIMMWIAALLCFIVYAVSPGDPSNLYLGIVLAFVVSTTGILAYFQGQKSEEMMEAFKNFIPPETTVIRENKTQKMQAKELVPGDIVIIENGKRIPADVRILESNGMKVDNSSLTGESLLLMRQPECTNAENPLETKNLAFFGTFCKEGTGKGVVVQTGENTVIGQIAGLAANSNSGESPLRKEINMFIKYIAMIAFVVGIVFLIFGLTEGYDAITSILFCIGIIVGFVPTGLLATVTVALTLTARKLASKKVLVKNLEGVETLGSTSCICSDKTGTLTQNRMTVENLWYNGQKCKGHNKQKYGPKYDYQYDTNEKGCADLIECAAICSEAVFDEGLPQEKVIQVNNDVRLTEQQKKEKLEIMTKEWQHQVIKIPWLDRPTIGDASETALIKFLQPIQDIEQIRQSRKIAQSKSGKLAKLPFNSQNKYAFIIVEYETEDSDYCLLTKGAPERVWALCENVSVKGVPERKDEKWEQKYNRANLEFGKNGERVLGFSKYHLPSDQFPKGYQFDIDTMNFPFNKQSFVGLVSLIDPPKDAVPNAVIKCKTAGIKVVMVTGDQPVTAAAIARQCNIITEKTVNEIAEERGCSFQDCFFESNAIVIHGDLLTKMQIEDEGRPESEKGKILSDWLDKTQIVFARTSPAQKLIIVDACQKKGHIVAVTGDGVNDSPAIKKADIGISMGITGSDVAKDAADMILLNDDFSNIVIGVEEGRKIFDNLKKTIIFVLCGTICEALPYLCMVAVRIPLPITTVLILFIDLGIGIITGTSFVYEEAELDIMTRRPRNKEDHMVTPKLLYFSYCINGFIQFIAALFTYYVIMNDFGYPAEQLFGLNFALGVAPLDTDSYDAQSPFFGNSVLRNRYFNRLSEDMAQGITNTPFCSPDDSSDAIMADWLYASNCKQDMRLYFVSCNTDTGQWKSDVQWGSCNTDQVSPYSKKPVCYTTEALQYAQTGYYFSMIVTQIFNYFSQKTSKTSVFYHSMGNWFMYWSFHTLLIILICLAYVYPLNVAIQSRDLLFQHIGIPAIPFGLLLIFTNEFRKYMIRNSPMKGNVPNWWYRTLFF